MSDNTYSIRKGNLEDLDTLVNMRMEFLLESNHVKAEEETAGISNELRSFIKTHLDTDLHMWLVEIDDKPIATGAASIWCKLPTHVGKTDSTKLAYISNMYTKPEYRKRGIASAVVKEINEFLRSQGIPKVMLHALEDGKGVYKNCGFETNDSFMEMKLK